MNGPRRRSARSPGFQPAKSAILGRATVGGFHLSSILFPQARVRVDAGEPRHLILSLRNLHPPFPRPGSSAFPSGTLPPVSSGGILQRLFWKTSETPAGISSVSCFKERVSLFCRSRGENVSSCRLSSRLVLLLAVEGVRLCKLCIHLLPQKKMIVAIKSQGEAPRREPAPAASLYIYTHTRQWC